MANVHLFGIRHHGPGSARSLVHALERVQPDVVLIEGPPDANDLIPLAAHAQLVPPVALLIYVPNEPRQAVLYPFAHYSPEWQAIQFALARKLSVRFIDLPQSARLRDSSSEEISSEDEADETTQDPLAPMAIAAGYSDTERWWDHLVESRAGHDVDVFKAIHEMMSELRGALERPVPLVEQQREAHMRKCIRAASAEGFANIAVVCGAWHTPALADMPSAKSDDALLKGLPKVKTAAAWTPWSYERLSYRSGYGAGVDSPVWYELLWDKHTALGARWMTRAARLLRDEDIPVSSAHVIEACRLADALASVRGRPVPGLAEYNDAAVSVLGSGDALALQLIHRRWHFGDRLGIVPEEFPTAPVQQDLAALQKKLRLPPKAEEKTLDLDLREAIDRERSQLLRRLRLLGIEWGRQQTHSGGRGTFHELWQIGWRPEFAIALIEASRYGHTVEQAATGLLAERSANAGASLASLIGLLDDALFADLPTAITTLVAAIENRAAVAVDVLQLLDAVPPLANVCRYGNVRGTDVSLVAEILSGLVPRITVGCPAAASHIDDDAAQSLWTKLIETNRSLEMLGNADFMESWRGMLQRIAQSDAVHALIGGYAHRILYDSGLLDFEALSLAFARSLSPGNEPVVGAHWVEGLLSGSGAVLVHDDRLRGLIAQWVRNAPPDNFVQVLPLLRRTFAQFPAPERRQIGERLRAGQQLQATAANVEFDEAAARAVLPVLKRIWNLSE
ncbi:DUF5682 family protein [Steroidobacter flavus]|uniref:DUF5682 family protein n=1 Tax=Steroidobacter flavus TaxID=1842136 RepID=A0ABV8SKQ9_9GAMM